MKKPADLARTLIDIRCGVCDQTFPVALSVLRDADQVQCRCGHAITLSGGDLVDWLRRSESRNSRKLQLV